MLRNYCHVVWRPPTHHADPTAHVRHPLPIVSTLPDPALPRNIPTAPMFTLVRSIIIMYWSAGSCHSHTKRAMSSRVACPHADSSPPHTLSVLSLRLAVALILPLNQRIGRNSHPTRAEGYFQTPSLDLGLVQASQRERYHCTRPACLSLHIPPTAPAFAGDLALTDEHIIIIIIYTFVLCFLSQLRLSFTAAAEHTLVDQSFAWCWSFDIYHRPSFHHRP